MFLITQDPSSGSIDSYLIKTTRNGSKVLDVCAVGVWRHMQDMWCVCVLRDPKHVGVILMCGSKLKLHGLSPRANYTDRAAAAGQRS
jgi:hypothetical protein